MYVAPIVEVFSSLQGEGKNIGKPSIFVRVWNCNLRCRFNGIECDTPYAVYKEKDKAVMQDEKQLVERVKTLKVKHVVWTGGEPALYINYIVEVMKLLGEEYTCEIETNGTIPVTKELIEVVDHFNISVKLRSSNQENDTYDRNRIRPKALDSFPDDKSYFKFVVTGAKDIAEILDLHKQYPQYPVYLMPEGITRDMIIKHSPEVADICIQYGFMFSPREHIIIWDMKRGI